MISERYIQGPTNHVKFGCEKFGIDYRRRYYGNGVHFTYILVRREKHPDEYIELGPIQTGFSTESGDCQATHKLTVKEVKEIVTTALRN